MLNSVVYEFLIAVGRTEQSNIYHIGITRNVTRYLKLGGGKRTPRAKGSFFNIITKDLVLLILK